jgi:thiol-disulfide isomerase/thioredoxin
VCLSALPATAAGPPPFAAKAWLNGPDGLVAGITAAEQDGKVLLVYFYTDWCGYCRQLEKTVLDTPAFAEFVAAQAAVRVNPEKGPRERDMASFYDVRGFPALFVYGRASKRLIPIERYDLVNGQPRLLSVGELIARIKLTSGS